MVFSYFNSSDIFTNSAKAFIKSGQPNMVLVLSLVFIYLTQFSTIYKRLAPQSRLYLCTVNTYELHMLLLKPKNPPILLARIFSYCGRLRWRVCEEAVARVPGNRRQAKGAPDPPPGVGGDGWAVVVTPPMLPPPRVAFDEPPERRLPHVDATAVGTAIAGRAHCSWVVRRRAVVVVLAVLEVPVVRVIPASPVASLDVLVHLSGRRDYNADTCWPAS